ncbi:hypothetical protein Fmac_028299 [Flemingia macrophylla]|uniref:Secreted protein n=1 Tax=Flemingia macrophylla TaxID=520843 RepID=A0ABD1L734_9FABA
MFLLTILTMAFIFGSFFGSAESFISMSIDSSHIRYRAVFLTSNPCPTVTTISTVSPHSKYDIISCQSSSLKQLIVSDLYIQVALFCVRLSILIQVRHSFAMFSRVDE